MASKIDTIATLVVSQIAALTGTFSDGQTTVHAALSPASDISHYPFCQVKIDGGEEADLSFYGVTQRPFEMIVWVEGAKSDVSSLIETLWSHWENVGGADYLALKGVDGFKTIDPKDAEEPFAYDGDKAIGVVTFTLWMRYP